MSEEFDPTDLSEFDSVSDYQKYWEAEKDAATAAESEVSAAIGAIQLRREERKDAFDQSQDYRHNYVTFNYPFEQDTVQMLCTTLRRMVRMNPERRITVELFSPGGEIMAGFAAYDTILSIRNQGTPVDVVVRGEACSMAAIILQAGTNRIVGPNARLMLHRASFGAIGSAFTVEDTVEETQKIEQQIYDLLAERTSKSSRQWKTILGKRKDVWFSAKEALDIGLCDTIG